MTRPLFIDGPLAGQEVVGLQVDHDENGAYADLIVTANGQSERYVWTGKVGLTLYESGRPIFRHEPAT